MIKSKLTQQLPCRFSTHSSTRMNHHSTVHIDRLQPISDSELDCQRLPYDIVQSAFRSVSAVTQHGSVAHRHPCPRCARSQYHPDVVRSGVPIGGVD